MAGMIQEQREPIFQEIVSGIEAELPKELKRDYTAIVTAGMKILFGDDTHTTMIDRLAEGRKNGDIPGAIVTGTKQLIQLIASKSQGRVNPAAAFPAAATLMAYIFEFAEAQEPGIQFPNELVAEATRSLMRDLAKAFHITQEQLGQGVEELQKSKGGQSPAAPVEPAVEPTAPAAPMAGQEGVI